MNNGEIEVILEKDEDYGFKLEIKYFKRGGNYNYASHTFNGNSDLKQVSDVFTKMLNQKTLK